MSFEFNAEEVLSIAEQMERNGAKFYRKAAEQLAQPTMRDKLIRLAEMEDGHEKTFAAMKARLSKKERASTTFDPDGDSAGYLDAMARGHVFDAKKDPTTFLTGKESLKDVLQFAVGLEKESVVFYTGIKGAVPPELGAAWIDAIIKEEMGHIALLSNELRAS